jgi:uncharacterized protein (UPF0332 family)
VIAAMPFDWSEYLQLADELGARADEGSLRSAISRAYYYVYHLALERAETNSFQARSGEGMHTQLWRCYSDNPEPACIKLGQIALRLRERRARADYRPIYPRIREEVPDVLADARDFASRLRNLDPRHPNPSSLRR